MLKDKEIKAHSREQIISGMLFALEVMLLFFMSSFFFPGSDELDFQNYLSFSSLNEFLHNVYYFGNGRFIGNAIGVFFSFYPQWFYVVQSVLTALFCVLIEKLTDVRHARHFVMAFFILKPVWCFAETFVRIAMYANYFIPLLLFALTLLIIKKAYRDNKILSFPLLAALFVAGFAEQLFVESNTVVNTAFSLLLVLFFIKKRKKNRRLSFYSLQTSSGRFRFCFTAFMLMLSPHSIIRLHLLTEIRSSAAVCQTRSR